MDLVSIPANPVPEDVVTGMLKTRDGVGIRFARWLPPPGRKGTVCVFQGRAEFIEKYFETVRELRARGFAVATIDWRGQGGSERALSDPHKGHVGDFSQYELDVEALMKDVVLPDCPPPIFAIGHSMGGTVMMRVARQGSRWFDRIVLSAPMIRLSGKRNAAPARYLMQAMRLIGMGSRWSSTPSTGSCCVSSSLRTAGRSDRRAASMTIAILTHVERSTTRRSLPAAR